MPERAVLVDTNVILEAVRTGIWRAISGGERIETVEECREEVRRGDFFSSGSVRVGESELGLIRRIHPVDESQRAALLLELSDVELDDGELDLLAHCLHRDEPPAWVVASPDRAAVRAAVRLQWGNRLVSLEKVALEVGCHRRQLQRLRPHFRAKWLKRARTDALLQDPP